MLITSIEKQKNNIKRYSVFVDYKFAFGIDEVDLIYFKLKENSNISEETYNYILSNLLLKNAKDKALKYLAYKMRSEKEIKDKLLTFEFSSEIIEQTIDFLKKYNYINDEEYAKAFIKDKVNLKGYGMLKIKYELKLKGIPEYLYNEYLEDESFINEIEIAEKLLIKKMRNIESIDFKQKNKLYSYLSRRGFSYDIINTVFDKILEKNYE